MILVCVTDRHLSTTIGEHHVQNLITLKLDEIKIFQKIYMTIMTVTQPYSAIWITLFKLFIIISRPTDFYQYVCWSRQKNLCRSQNSMKPFYLYWANILWPIDTSAHLFWISWLMLFSNYSFLLDVRLDFCSILRIYY